MRQTNADIKLNTGALMPMIGLGTWKSAPNQAGEAVLRAISEYGYRHIDCAAIYRNEKEIGKAFKNIFENKIRRREDIFITSKLWNTEHRKSDVRKACEATLADLNLKYLDLYLMHWGVAIPPHDATPEKPLERFTEQKDANGFLITEKVSIRETWEAMEELIKASLVKAIGVSNFTAPMLIDILSYAKIKPAINQVELHAYLQQSELLEFCKHNDIVMTAYSPLGSPGNFKEKGFPILIEDSAVKEIARAHDKSPAQILIRWGIQRKTVVIPKSVTPERIKENIDVFDFELSEAEMKIIAGLNRNLRFVNPYPWWKIPYYN